MDRLRLIETRARLTDLRAFLMEDLGMQALVAVLDLDPTEAQSWIRANGDPIQDPNASLALAREAGLSDKTVSLSAFAGQPAPSRLDPMQLAVSMVETIIDMLLRPHGAPPRGAH